MKIVVFDIETKNTFQEAGTNDPAGLDISMVCAYDYESDKYSSFTENELSDLWPILENANLLVGYNSEHFDIPLLNKYYPGDLTKIRSLDILNKIKESYGRRMKLDQVAQATLGIKKGGHGLDAIRWWKNGEIEKIRKYCLEDVRITKEVFDYALKNNKLFFQEGGKKNEIILDTKNWTKLEDSGMTHTMGF